MIYKKAIYSNGVTTYVDMTQEEIAEMLASHPVQEWHDPNAYSRITMSLSDNFRLLKMHPGFAQYVSDAGLISEEENGYIYVYVNFVLDEHRQLFNYLNSEQGFNITVEPKEKWQ